MKQTKLAKTAKPKKPTPSNSPKFERRARTQGVGAVVNTRELQSILATRGLSQRQFAKALGLDPSTIHYLLHGKRRLRISEVPAVSDVLGISPDEVLEHFGINLGAAPITKASHAVKIEGWLDGTLTLHLDGVKGKKVAMIPFGDKDIVAARAQTAGSEFFALDGALFFYRYSKIRKGPDPECLGKLCMVEVEGSSSLKLRVLKRGYSSGRFDLCSLSGRVMEEDVRVGSTHPVVWMKV